VKIADMGLAKSLGGEDSMQMTRSDSALGTPAYMAPEQAASAKDVGPASDIYALGATLYNLATGRVPFEGNSLFEVLSKVVSTPPPSICEQRPDITVNLERIAHKAMAKKAQDRYESAQAMAQDCARALEAIGAGSVVISSHRVLGLFEKRHIPTVLGAAGAVMALAIFIVLLLVLGQKPEEVIIEKMVPVAPVDEAKEDPEFAAAKAEIDAIAGLVKEGKLEDAYARAKLGADRFAGKPYANEFTQKASEVREATARAELDQVSRLTDEKKFDEAIRLAKAGADAYSDTTQAGQFRRRATEIRELHARSELDQILALQKSGDMSEALVRVKAASEQFADTTVASAIRQETRNIRQAQATKELEQIAALVDARKYDDAIGRANAGALAYADTLLAETFRERAASIGRLVQDNKRKADEVAQDRQRSAKHDRHIADGDSRLAAGDQLGALAAYNLAMGTLDTEDARRKIQSTRLALAEVEMKAARFEQALEQLLEAAKLVENPEVATRMNAAKRAIDARRHLDQATDQCRREEYDSAEQALTKARQTDPGYLTEAIASLEKRIADERSYRASLAQAREAYEKRAWSEIVESASKAIEVHPNDEQATKLLAEARRNIERPQETTNALGMAFRYVPGGTFQMGSSDGDPDEKPVRAVVLDQYYIGTHEVTNAQFEQYQPDHKKRRTGVSKDDTCPAANVSWLEAEAYCRWLTTRTGVKHRLPTEAEWEFAARGFDGRVYPWGNEAPKPADKRANWGEGKSAGAWAADGFAYTAPVGSFPAGQSPFGCMDMAGNVWEWVADWYGQYTATSASTVNPKGPRGGDTRVIRGGSWFHDGAHLRSANRSGKKPSVRVDLIGFRVVMEVEQ
jgi:formylglycine-generating enzyme required for sulfatase activity